MALARFYAKCPPVTGKLENCQPLGQPRRGQPVTSTMFMGLLVGLWAYYGTVIENLFMGTVENSHFPRLLHNNMYCMYKVDTDCSARARARTTCR